MTVRRVPLSMLARFAGATALAVLLTACGETTGGLAPGLVATMDSPGATLDRASAFDLLNQYRGTVGAGALADDPALDTTAQNLAQTYASTGTAPQLPTGAVALRASSGYNDFAETFSGWRNSPQDAAVLTTSSATHAGLAEFYDANSAYGVYWIRCLAPEDDLPPEDDLAPEDDTETVDARGLKCPLPVLMMEKRLASLPPGARLIVLATDPMAKIDIPLYCRQRGHACTVGDADGVLSFRLAKAGE